MHFRGFFAYPKYYNEEEWHFDAQFTKNADFKFCNISKLNSQPPQKKFNDKPIIIINLTRKQNLWVHTKFSMQDFTPNAHHIYEPKP